MDKPIEAVIRVLRGPCGSSILQSTPKSGQRAGYGGAKRKRGSQLHLAVDTLGHLVAAHVTPDAAAHRLRLIVVTHSEPRRGFVLLPRRRGVERSFAWIARLRLLTRDYERLPGVLAGFHVIAVACLMVKKAAPLPASAP